jgi:hypothetical protein
VCRPDEDGGWCFFFCGLDSGIYLAQTICWPATIDMDDALPRCSAPRRAVKDVSGILRDGFGS